MTLTDTAFRSITNSTPHPVSVELYLQEATAIEHCRGMLRVFLLSGEIKKLDIGNFRHANLNGIGLQFEIKGVKTSYRQYITQEFSELDILLNQNFGLILSSLYPLKIIGCNE